jgi:hypothetical protein
VVYPFIEAFRFTLYSIVSSDNRIFGCAFGEAQVDATGLKWVFNKELSFDSADRLKIVGRVVTKTSGTSAWDTGQVANQKFSGDAAIHTKITQTDKHRAMGLSKVDVDQADDTIDFGLFFGADSVVKVIENGTFYFENGPGKSIATGFGTYAIGDVFSIERVGTTIHYKKNGTTFYTSTKAAPTTDLLVDFSLHEVNASLNISMGPSNDLSAGSNKIKARVEDSTTGKKGPESAEIDITINSADPLNSLIDTNNLLTVEGDNTTIDLTKVSGVDQNQIDAIDLDGTANTGTGNKVIIHLDDVMAAGTDLYNDGNGWSGLVADPARHQIKIDGIAGNTVEATGWTKTADTYTVNNEIYRVYTNAANANVQLLIDEDIAVVLI